MVFLIKIVQCFSKNSQEKQIQKKGTVFFLGLASNFKLNVSFLLKKRKKYKVQTDVTINNNIGLLYNSILLP